MSLKDAPPDFHLLTRLLGPQEQNIEFLKIQTKASVELLGEGSMNPSVEPLHFLVRLVYLIFLSQAVSGMPG